MTEEVKKKTKQEFIEAMKREYYEIQSIDDNLKVLKEDAKEAGYDATLLAKTAKALADSKVDDIISKNEAFADLIKEVRYSY